MAAVCSGPNFLLKYLIRDGYLKDTMYVPELKGKMLSWRTDLIELIKKKVRVPKTGNLIAKHSKDFKR